VYTHPESGDGARDRRRPRDRLLQGRIQPKPHVQYHKDGSIWARGQTLDGVPAGYWEWFRKDGTKLRSGHFENGEQSG